MISLWFFFVFVTIFCIGFTLAEKLKIKVIDGDIWNRKIEFKAKNEIIKMNRNESKFERRIWTNKYVQEHHAFDKSFKLLYLQ